MLLDLPFLAAIPVVLIVLFQGLKDFRPYFFLMFFCIPFSADMEFGSLGADLPIELIMVGLMLVTLLLLVAKPQVFKHAFLMHPLILLIILHLGWMFLSMCFSEVFLVSLKYCVAKLWYILPIIFLGSTIIRSEKDLDRIFWMMFSPMIFTVAYTIYHHWKLDFGFREINEACQPFYHNHVDYAAIMAYMMPFVLWQILKRPKFTPLWGFLIFSLLLMVFGLATCYTRAAIGGVAIAAVAYFGLRWRLIVPGMVVSLVVMLLVVIYMLKDNRYMDYLPSERTIAHESFNDIVSSTSNLQDVSTMERYYRWVAGFRMSVVNPVFGFGPNSFYFCYKKYTLQSFETYVSDNPEKSSAHNYFIQMMVEQGFVGLFIFFMLTLVFFLIAQRAYNEAPNDERRGWVGAVFGCMVVIDSFLLMNDMIETDEVGIYYFLNITSIVLLDLWNKRDREALLQEQAALGSS